MKKQGILHAELSEVIAGLGHTDTLVVADAGLPIPPGVLRIDLAVVGGVPPFMDVLKAILGDVQVEKAVIASEMASRNASVHANLLAALGSIPVEEISHEELKRMTRSARAVVRTGEFTPYANVILTAGVVF